MHCHERSRRQAQCGGGDHNCITRFHAANMYSSVISTCSESRTMTESSGVSCVCALRSCAAMDGSDAERRERFIAANDSRLITDKIFGFTARPVSRMFHDVSQTFRTCFASFTQPISHVSHMFRTVLQVFRKYHVTRTLFHTCFASANYVVTSREW